jgi:hypothetical protein
MNINTIYICKYKKNQSIKMKQSILIRSMVTVAILVIAVTYSKSQVKKGKKSLFA